MDAALIFAISMGYAVLPVPLQSQAPLPPKTLTPKPKRKGKRRG